MKVKKTEPIGEQYYAWSIYVSEQMRAEVSEILGQWRTVPDFKEGETWRSSAMAVHLEQDKSHITGYYTEKRVSSNKDRKRAFPTTSNPVQKDVWTYWICHIKWDYRIKVNKGTGFVEAWQQVDGKGYKKTIDYKGPIGYNYQIGVYLKWGIYRYPWKRSQGKQSPRYHYYHDVKIADAEPSFNEMKVTKE